MSRAAHPDQGEEDLYGERLGAGALAGSYLIDALVAEGGFAAIYRARDMATGAAAAVKVLRADFAVSTRMLRRFWQEAWAVHRIRNPHIVDLLETGSLHDGRPFLAMEWLDGHDLAAALRRRGAMPLGEVLDIAEQMARALSAAHAAGIVHRDLKAQNVMLLPRDHGFLVKVVDFGIAKLLDPPEGSTALTTATIIGTPIAMAPEQILRQPVDARTDIYAFGVLLFQLATGTLPFDGASPIEIEDKHLHAPPPRASERAPLPAGFDDIVMRCMQKDKAARFDSIDELIDTLRQLASQAQPSSAAQPAAVPCIGVHVTAVVDAPGAADDDALLDEIDAVLDEAHDVLARAGLAIAVESGNAVLGVAVVGEVDPGRVREAVLALARPGTAVAVHVDQAERRGDRFVGGALFRLGMWIEGRTRAGQVTVTPAAASALGGALGALPGTSPGASPGTSADGTGADADPRIVIC